MEVILAKTAGFCFGVQRAVDSVNKEIENTDSPLYTYGPIIHNQEVIRNFESKGVKVINENDDLGAVPNGRIIIRSHGISRAEHEKLLNNGFEVIDATCPFVLKIHKYVDKYSNDGYFVIIVGNDKHPEVEGIKGWCNGPHLVAASPEELDFDKIPKDRKLCIVSQTTFRQEKFQELVEIITKNSYDVTVLNTICSATEERQTEAAKLAAEVDTMIVVGSNNSSNTQKLYDICSNKCKKTIFVQTADELDLKGVDAEDKIGITAGASTPKYIIKEVQTKCQK